MNFWGVGTLFFLVVFVFVGAALHRNKNKKKCSNSSGGLMGHDDLFDRDKYGNPRGVTLN